MEKTALRRTDRAAPRFWRATARRIQSARLTGRLFTDRDGEAQQAAETVTESFDEPFESTSRADDQSAGGSRERIVLYALGPISEADLLKENLERSATIRRHRRRRKRFRPLTDNAGIVVFVIFLFALAWFVADG